MQTIFKIAFMVAYFNSYWLLKGMTTIRALQNRENTHFSLAFLALFLHHHQIS